MTDETSDGKKEGCRMSEEKTVKLDAKLHHELKLEALKRGEQLKTLIDRILREWLERAVESVEVGKEAYKCCVEGCEKEATVGMGDLALCDHHWEKAWKAIVGQKSKK